MNRKMTYRIEIQRVILSTRKMFEVSLEDFMKMLKMGLDPKFIDFFEVCDDEQHYLFWNLSVEDKLFFVEKTEANIFAYEQLLIHALHTKNGELEYINTILERCNQDEVYNLMYDDQEAMINFFEATNRWDLCKEAVIHSNPCDCLDYSEDFECGKCDKLKKVFLDYLVTEEEYCADEKDLLPYIHSLIDSLISLPVYVIYKIINETYHAHKYFEEWEIISMIQLAKGEDTIYINHPEYEDCYNFSDLTLEEQEKIFETTQEKFKHYSKTFSYDAEKRERCAMQMYWILYTPKIRVNIKMLKVLNKYFLIPQSLSKLEQKYMKKFGTWIESDILTTYKNDFSD